MSLSHESTGVSPCFAEKGYEPRTSFDWTDYETSQRDIDREAAAERAKRMEEIWERARDRISSAQTSQAIQANRHRREADFSVGDRVFLSLRPYQTSRPNKKLDNQQAGPFPIVEKIGNSFKLDLPESMKVHPVISPDKLRKAAPAETSLPGQYDDPSPAIDIEGENEWEVDEILAVRLRYRKLQYRVKWTGHDIDNTWYPASNLKNCAVKLRLFHDRYPEMPGPPKRLSDWLRAADNDEFDRDHPDDNSPMEHRSGRAISKGGGSRAEMTKQVT